MQALFLAAILFGNTSYAAEAPALECSVAYGQLTGSRNEEKAEASQGPVDPILAKSESSVEKLSDDVKLWMNPYHGNEDEELKSALQELKQARSSGADVSTLNELAKKIDGLKNYIQMRDAAQLRGQLKESERLTAAVQSKADKFKSLDFDFRTATRDEFEAKQQAQQSLKWDLNKMDEYVQFRGTKDQLVKVREDIGKGMMDKFLQGLDENQAVENLKQGFVGETENMNLVRQSTPANLIREPYMDKLFAYTAKNTKPLKLCRLQSVATEVNGSWFFPCGMMMVIPKGSLRDFLALPNAGQEMKIVEVAVPAGKHLEISVARPVMKVLGTTVDTQFGGPLVGGGGIGGGVQIRIPDFSSVTILKELAEP